MNVLPRPLDSAPSSDPPRVGVLTVSTTLAEEGGSDESGDALVDFAAEMEGLLVGRELVADDREEIEACLCRWADGGGCDLILATGGTGFAASDVTPEATEAVIERPAPGIAEAMRAASAPHTPHWMLSRAPAGIRGATLIVNFPGSPKAIAEIAQVLQPTLSHAIALLRETPKARSS